ncbi:hypothetical protein E2C01_052751 [Portunus trituberculatus]|uniref:Uncharacterized protein n=1 Tax=Portunus trituberculatus TaxID=210409 RepID=A0A5B7GII0_PORTR|nr:hypothetical protein [Portunus trituberculatus]
MDFIEWKDYRTTVPGPMQILPDGSDWTQKPVPFRVTNILRKSRNGGQTVIHHLGVKSSLENPGLERKS